MNVAPFSFPPAFIGVGYGIPVPGGKPIKADPEQEYVAGGFGYLSRGIPQVLPWMVDDVTRDFGPQVYDAMHTDPFVGSTFRLLKMQILANELQLIPAVLPSDQVKGDPDKKGWTPDEKLSQDIVDFCQRSLDRCKTPIHVVLSEMLDSMRHGNKLSELVAEVATEGDDAGKVVLCDIKVKPRWSWLFVADVFLNTLGILAFDPGLGGYVIVPRDKFFILSWQIEDNDPRGKSLYRQCYRAWNTKQLAFPEYYKYLIQFAGPLRIGFTSPEESFSPIQPVDVNGVPIAGAAPISRQQYMVNALTNLHSGVAAAFPADAKVQTEWPQGNGESYLSALDYMNREIVYGMVGTTRDSMEAEHGSKADSETSENKTGNLIRTAREWLSTGFRSDVLKWLVTANWGKEIADRLTPKVSLGDSEHQDIVALMNGIASMIKAGAIDKESQLPAIHAMLNLPPAAPGAFDGASNDPVADAAQAKADAAGETKPGKPAKAKPKKGPTK